MMKKKNLPKTMIENRTRNHKSQILPMMKWNDCEKKLSVQKIVAEEDIRAQDQVEVIEIDEKRDVIVVNRDQTATMMR
jgi:hypothetical protein